ncbi:hypothetical protein B9T25_12235 [Acinetobacter sp. ANC 4470]|nr:hypothetical protein B9T25_12235 [Acinetobacter sp. ANC 4470]
MISGVYFDCVIGTFFQESRSPTISVRFIMDGHHKQYDPAFPKQTHLTVGRVGWSAWEINHKLADRK